MTDIDRIHAAMSSKPTDIVERLRGTKRMRTSLDETLNEAADEIERLQAALQALADDNAVPPWIRTLAHHALEFKS